MLQWQRWDGTGASLHAVCIPNSSYCTKPDTELQGLLLSN